MSALTISLLDLLRKTQFLKAFVPNKEICNLSTDEVQISSRLSGQSYP